MLFFLFIAFVFSQDSICDKYSQALNLNNSALVTTVVNGVVQKLVGPGAALTKKYFDGTKPAGSTNFLDPRNAAALADLVGSLVRFFGQALGCSDGTIKPYTGPAMDKVHQPMGINLFESIAFNDAVVAVLAAAGVSEIDQVAVRIVLNSLKTSIVVQNSICDRYSAALKVSNQALVKAVVLGVFGAVTMDGAPTLKYFNGVKPPGSMNFLNPKNQAALDGLVNGLITFFGTALGCSDETIGPYGGPSMTNVHKRMRINENEFNFFNLQVLNVLRTSGVARADLITVSKLLNSTKSVIVSA